MHIHNPIITLVSCVILVSAAVTPPMSTTTIRYPLALPEQVQILTDLYSHTHPPINGHERPCQFALYLESMGFEEHYKAFYSALTENIRLEMRMLEANDGFYNTLKPLEDALMTASQGLKNFYDYRFAKVLLGKFAYTEQFNTEYHRLVFQWKTRVEADHGLWMEEATEFANKASAQNVRYLWQSFGELLKVIGALIYTVISFGAQFLACYALLRFMRQNLDVHGHPFAFEFWFL